LGVIARGTVIPEGAPRYIAARDRKPAWDLAGSRSEIILESAVAWRGEAARLNKEGVAAHSCAASRSIKWNVRNSPLFL